MSLEQNAPTGPTNQDQDPVQPPPLRLVRGDASPEEIAGIVAVLAAWGGQDPPRPEVRSSRWADPHARLRAPHTHGRGVWRGSALPR